ncbi:hypothetical protein GH733_009480 [Mirounga leonina]|nr:hypothetical protein GH733_009480 [Mirounga leonina]
MELVIPAGPAARQGYVLPPPAAVDTSAGRMQSGSEKGALYFHIGETEKKCFIEEIPDETMVIGNYRTQLYDKQREEYQPATPGLGMFVEVKDPEDKVSRPLSPAEPSALHFSARPGGCWYFPPTRRSRSTAGPPSPQIIRAQQYGSEGRFTFTSHTPGEHQICPVVS